MTEPIGADQIRAWIDNELVEAVDLIPDDAAEFNLTVEMSGMLIHVIRRQPNGPLLIGQQIEYGDDVRTQIRELSAAKQNELVTRIRETLTTTPGIYGFHDEHGTNVSFSEMQRIFLEYRIYPDQANQQYLMDGLIGIWKAMRYLDDLPRLIEYLEDSDY